MFRGVEYQVFVTPYSIVLKLGPKFETMVCTKMMFDGDTAMHQIYLLIECYTESVRACSWQHLPLMFIA